MTITTGYFADPEEKTWTKVHAVRNGKPLCGCKISDGMEYQWCSQTIQKKYIECERCLQKLKRMGL